MKKKSLNFWATDSFIHNNGQISRVDYSRLKMDILKGKGDILPAAGGLRIIECNVSGKKRETHTWLVVFAVYARYNLVVLISKYQMDIETGFIEFPLKDASQGFVFKRKFTIKQQIQLC